MYHSVLHKCLWLFFLISCITQFTYSSNNKDTLIFCCDENYPPFDFVDNNGNATGYNVDLIREVATVAGLNVKIIPGKWADIFAKLKTGTIDGITGMYVSESRKTDFLFSDAVRWVTHVAICRPESGIYHPDDLAGKTLVVQTDDIMHQYVVENIISEKIISEKNVMSAIKRFKAGEGDALLINRMLAYSSQNIINVKKYQVVAIPVDPMPYCFALHKDNTVLLRKLDEGLNILAFSGKYNEVYLKWFGPEIQNNTWKSVPFWAWILAGALLLVSIVSFVWNYSLRYTVNNRTQQLRSELRAKELAEQQYRTAVNRLKIVQSSAGMGIWEINFYSEEMFWDEGMYQLHGLEKTVLPVSYKHWLQMIHPDDREETELALQHCLNNKTNFSHSYRIIASNGKEKYIRTFAHIRYTKSGEAKNAIGVSWDESDKEKYKLVQEALFSISQAAVISDSLYAFMDKIRKELSRIVDTSNLFIGLLDETSDNILLPYMKDEHQTFTYFPTRNSISRYVISQGKSMLLYDEDLEKFHNEGIIQRAGGRAQVWLGVPLRIKEKITGIIVLQNYHQKEAITTEHVRILEYIAPHLSQAIKRKQDEEMIQKTSDILKKAEQIAHLGSFEWNSHNNQFIFSDEIYRLFGLNNKEKTYSLNTFKTLLHPNDEPLFWNVRDQVKNGQKSFEFEFRIFRFDTGEMSVLFLRGAELKTQENNSGIYTGIVQDITEQKKIHEEIIKSKEKAEESDRLKSAFLANMSHEIRTPMNSIIGFSQMLPEATDETEQLNFISIINKNGEHLLKLIDHIIDISKIEAGAMPLDEITFDIDDLMKDSKNQFLDHEKLKSGAITVQIEKPKEFFETTITSDYTKLRQVLTNLLYNAIKFSTNGTVAISFSLSDKDTLLFCVKDQGIGIPPEKISHIFDRFMQAGVDISSKETGAGLGLALCRAYINLLGGKIWVESIFKKGSIFSFTIPYHPSKTTHSFRGEEQKILPTKTTTSTVLIAEDNDDNYYFLIKALKNTGLNFVRTTNGIETIELFKNTPGISLILMDIRMPDMDGLTATSEIKAINPNIPIIAQTAYALDGDREKALLAGCTDYISKPIRRNVLISKIMTYLNR